MLQPRRALLLPALALTLSAAAHAQEKPFALRNATLIDGSGAPPRAHTTILVSDGKITAVQPDAARLPSGVAAQDLKGAVVLPGLVTAHAHLGLLESNAVPSPSAYTRDNVTASLNQFERYGVTTIVSLGLNRDLVYELRSEQRAGKLGGATILTAGRGVGVPGGAPPINTGPDQVYRPASPDEARKDVDELAARHADIVKIWVDPLHGKMPEMQPAVYSTVISEAHARGLHVAAHEYALADASQLVTDGVDVLAHSVRDRPVDADFIQLMRSHGTWYIPTFTVDETFFLYAEHPAFMATEFFKQAAGPQLLAKFNAPEYAGKVQNDPDTAQHRQDLATGMRNFKALYDAGLPIAFGTDAGAMPGRIPGFSEHRELADLVTAGLTPLQAVTLATGRSGDLIHTLDPSLRVGRIAPGYAADLIVLQTHTFDTIESTRRITAIYHGGRKVENPAPAN